MNRSIPTPLRRRSLRHGAAALLLAAPASAQIWSEEFDVAGPPDPSIWSYDLGTGSNGWGNNELQTYTSSPGNVEVRQGRLVITARRSGGGFSSARIRTQDKLTFQYGTVEARIRVPNMADGLWPAFWTLGNSFGTVGWPRCGEIDVLEMGASEGIRRRDVNRRVYSTAHWEQNGRHTYYGLSRVQPSDLDDGFHVWRMEWTPAAISTYVDGQWIWTIDISNPASFSGYEFHAPHFFLVNLAIGGNFPGIYTTGGITAPLPAEYQVDWIRLYDNGHTILGGSGVRRPAARVVRDGFGNFNGFHSCTDPVLGTSMDLFVRRPDPSFQLGGLVGYSGAANIPFGASTLLVDLNSAPLISLPPSQFVFAGLVGWSIPIPGDPSLAGLRLTTQGVLVGSGLGLTNAVDLRLGY